MSEHYLEQIQKPNDIHGIPREKLPQLAGEVRDFLIRAVSEQGGHLASNLGVVELTIALHYTLTLPRDKIIWDVGHQAYTHKILTGRKEDFAHLREFGGLSGFPKQAESPCDAFDTGHSSTSLSVGLGMACARELAGETYSVVSVIGDGAMTGGMAFEALNNAARLKSNFIIILNDNHMSIGKNVGGLSHYLWDIRTGDRYLHLKKQVHRALSRLPGGEEISRSLHRSKSSIKQLIIPGMFFEDLGITYFGPVDGHNIPRLLLALQEAKKVQGPVLIHVGTVKGKGFAPAEKDPEKFHGVGPFHPENTREVTGHTLTYTQVFARSLLAIAKQNPKVLALTAAMPEGTGLHLFQKHFPKRFFDVGIAEEHAVTFAAGLSAAGFLPVVAVYSSFLQRAYDQILHDVCLQELHVVFAVDRAGLVGKDGETHQGIFDLSFLSSIPGMCVMAPKNRWELTDMLAFAIERCHGPVAIRYPRGKAYEGLKNRRTPIVYGKAEALYEEEGICLMAVGTMVKLAERVRRILKDKGFSVSLVNARFIKPLDKEMVRSAVKEHKLLVPMEENVAAGAFGSAVEAMVFEEALSCEVLAVSLPDEYIEQGDFETLQKEIHLDAETVAMRIMTRFIGL